MALSDKQLLQRKIQTYSFTLTDIILYLDSHPECQEGLKYYHKHKKIYEKAVEEYEKTYGPLTALGVCDNDKWTWATTAFPWERGES